MENGASQPTFMLGPKKCVLGLMMIEISIDGSCEPVNPGGTACYGYVIRRQGKVLSLGSGVAGTGKGMTNNVAEYNALISAIGKIEELGLERDRIIVKSDSNLLVHQMKGDWQVKAPLLIPLHRKAMTLTENLEISFEWVPREKNEEADELAREAYRKASKF
jgi:ribonuclease HI